MLELLYEKTKTKLLSMKLLYVKAENFLLGLRIKRLEKQIYKRKTFKY